MEKKRVIKSLDKLEGELKSLFKKKYPDGYENSLIRLSSATNEPFFAVPLETEDSTYLIKIAMIKNSDGGYDIDEEGNEGDDDENFSGGGDYDGDYDDD